MLHSLQAPKRVRAPAHIEADKKQHAAEHQAERERRVANFREKRAAAANEAEELAKWKTDNFKSMLEHNIEEERRAKAKDEEKLVKWKSDSFKDVIDDRVDKKKRSAEQEAERNRTAVVPHEHDDKSILEKSMKAYEQKVDLTKQKV